MERPTTQCEFNLPLHLSTIFSAKKNLFNINILSAYTRCTECIVYTYSSVHTPKNQLVHLGIKPVSLAFADDVFTL